MNSRLFFRAKNLLMRAPFMGMTRNLSLRRSRLSESFKGLADGLDLSGIYESAFLHLVANHVSPISEINPWRESATAESRFQFTSAANMNEWGAPSLLCRWRSVSAKVLNEIDCRFLEHSTASRPEPPRRTPRRGFRALMWKNSNSSVSTRLVAGDGRAVDQCTSAGTNTRSINRLWAAVT